MHVGSEKFVSYLAATAKTLAFSAPPKTKAVAVFSTAGILFLETDETSGVLQSYPWKDVLSFGASSDQQFGFKVEGADGEEDVVFVTTAQSGHLCNVISKKLATLARTEKTDHPSEYRP